MKERCSCLLLSPSFQVYIMNRSKKFTSSFEFIIDKILYRINFLLLGSILFDICTKTSQIVLVMNSSELVLYVLPAVFPFTSLLINIVVEFYSSFHATKREASVDGCL